LEPPLCVVSSWVIRVYTILVWNTISGSSNLNNCFYHCLILISISHLKALFNLLLLLLLFIIYIVNLPVVRPRSCRIIYYFDTPALGRRHKSFGRVKINTSRWGRFEVLKVQRSFFSSLLIWFITFGYAHIEVIR